MATLTALAGCSAGDVEIPEEGGDRAGLGVSNVPLNACPGDSSQYDYNAFAASLAVAIANELGHWDVATDFTIINGKLELSTTGNLHCAGACPNIGALLRLQDDASSTVPNHSPSIFRSKLTSWYGLQRQKLSQLVDDMLYVDKGLYRIRSRSSGKYIVPSGRSTWDGAVLQQSDQYSWDSASEWRVVLKGTTHQLINRRSGKCMDLQFNTSGSTNLVQRSCNGSFTQGFRFARLDHESETYAIRTAHLQSLRIQNSSGWNGANVVQDAFHGDWVSEQFVLEPSSGAHEDVLEVATAVYSMTVDHTGMAIGVTGGSTADGALLEQRPIVASDDRYHWYVSKVDGSRYQLINRRSGKCLDQENPNDPDSRLVQRTCSTAESQRLFFMPTGEGNHAMYTHHGVTIGVENGSTSSGARLRQGGKTWDRHKLMALEPIIAGEPHHLSFTHTTSDGPCGDYYWFDITQPNGMPLDSPEDTFVQLIFAGGKQTPQGSDVNPYIAQRVSGDQVAIDPTYGLNGEGSTTTGSCTAACVRVTSSKIAGQCCSCNGRSKRYVRSAWNANTYLCQ